MVNTDYTVAQLNSNISPKADDIESAGPVTTQALRMQRGSFLSVLKAVVTRSITAADGSAAAPQLRSPIYHRLGP